MEANAFGGEQSIVFGYGVYLLQGTAESATTNVINETSGDLDITSDITLIGIGAQKSLIHGDAVDRVLEIHSGAVRIENLAITGGNAGAADGGGIHILGGAVELRRVAVDSNQAANGGGIMHAAGELNIVQSSLSHNIATSSGGGIMNQAQLTIENSTLSGNQANAGGGLLADSGNAQLRYVTVAGNSAAAGGGINNTGSVRIANTLLAGNDAPIGPDCAPNLTSDGRNLIGSLDGCTLSGDTGGNVIGQSPRLDVLTSNVAETYSHPLLTGSPAIGRAACVVNVDQTGAQRPTEGGCDIGAYETNAMGAGVYMPIIGR
jgi:hypothetical protein